MRSRTGFTLVELLVVITILAILSTIGLIAYSGAQKSARTAKRIGDLKAIQTALELYYSANREYPQADPWRTASGCGGWTQVAPNDVIPGLTPQYMPVIPTDPGMKNNGTSCYLYRSDKKDYKLLDHNIEDYNSNKKEYAVQPNLVDPARDNLGGECSKIDYNTTSPNIWSWAIYSSNNGVNDGTNPACW